jgi:Flp pilus assembly protein TadD
MADDHQTPAEPLAVARLRWWPAGAALAAVFLMAVTPFRSPDVWHHVRCGWHVLRHGPARTDPFSCTASALDLPWIQYEWLFQALTYLSHEHLGVGGTILLKALACAAAFLFLGLACRERGAGPAATAFALALAGLAAAPRFFVRPETPSFVALGLVLYALERGRNGRVRALWLAPPVFAVWANMHGAFAAGWALVAAALAGEYVSALRREPAARVSRRSARVHLGLVLAASLASVLANPYGVDILQVPLKLLRSPIIRSAVQEWTRPTLAFWLSPFNLFLPALALVCAWKPGRLRPDDWIILLLFGGLAISAERHVSVLAVVTTPMLACQSQALLDGVERRPVGRRLAGIAAATVAVAAVFVFHGPRLASLRFGLTPGMYPVMAADYMEQERLWGNLFNDYHDGNYLMWRLYPQNLVFVDGRIDVYGDQVMRAFDDVWNAYPPGQKVRDYAGWRVAEGWRRALDRHRVRACFVRYVVSEAEAERRAAVQVVSETGAPATTQSKPWRLDTQPLVDALWADAGWALIYWDDERMIFVRREDAAGRHAYRFRPDRLDAAVAATPEALRTALQDFERRVALGPRYDCVTARVCLAATLQAAGRFADAELHLRRAFDLKPHDGGRAYDLAACLLQLGRVADAEAWFRRSVDLGGPKQHKAWNGLGTCLRETGRPAEALRCFQEAIALEPHSVTARLSLSVALEDLGRRDEALAAAQRALDMAPASSLARQRVQELVSTRGRPGGR